MQIQSSIRTPLKHIEQNTTPPAQNKSESWLPTRDEVQLGASMLGGGLALGAGGMWLGSEVGMHFASKALDSAAGGQPAPIAIITVLAMLPVAMLYIGAGAAVGGAIGGTAGAALGYSAYTNLVPEPPQQQS